ncbi:hypothetical protein F4821DRAFT_274127 [Hypoxylon rubiginosum]|uniref:Uncharacterized protein n=1 Tax=Hypoxylon rubiginosum TaxID=110542 RepID=A0ACC0DLJ6_9PEZI|nr:hypothetical protein F4821DRAFT_274127 [Hypoxylon rubiginosum]
MFFADELDSLVKGFQSLTVQDPVYDLAECLSRFSIEEPPLSQVDWSASMDWEPTYLDLIPREGNCPPSSYISRQCSSNQTRNGSTAIPEVGLEDLFAGLEGFPDFSGTPGAFNVPDCWGEDNEGGTDRGGGSASGFDLGADGRDIHSSDSGWLGVPIPGQFPISNWLVDKLNTTHSGVEYRLPLERPMEPQYAHLNQVNLDQDVILDLNLSSLPTITGPHEILRPLAPWEQYASTIDMPLEGISPECLAQVELSCNNSGVPASSQDRSNEDKNGREKKHHCTQCDGRFSKAHDLQRHVQAKHQPSWEYCTQCGKKLKKRADNIQRHAKQYCKKRQ